MPLLLALGCVLVVLKALALISLPWIWVLCPFWIGLAIVVAVLLLGVVGAGGALGIAALMDIRRDKRIKAQRAAAKRRS